VRITRYWQTYLTKINETPHREGELQQSALYMWEVNYDVEESFDVMVRMTMMMMVPKEIMVMITAMIMMEVMQLG
jgi:hypothetical protein